MSSQPTDILKQAVEDELTKQYYATVAYGPYTSASHQRNSKAEMGLNDFHILSSGSLDTRFLAPTT